MLNQRATHSLSNGGNHLPPLAAAQATTNPSQQPARPSAPPPLNPNTVGVPPAPAPRNSVASAPASAGSPMSPLVPVRRPAAPRVDPVSPGPFSGTPPATADRKSGATRTAAPTSPDTPEKRRHRNSTGDDVGASEEDEYKPPPQYMYTMINRVSDGAHLTAEASASSTQPREDDNKSPAGNTSDNNEDSGVRAEPASLLLGQQVPYSVFLRPSVVAPRPPPLPEVVLDSPQLALSKTKTHEEKKPLDYADDFYDDAMAYLVSHAESKPPAMASVANSLHFSAVVPSSRANSLSRPAPPPPARSNRGFIPAVAGRSHDVSVFSTESFEFHAEDSSTDYDYTIFNRPARQSTVVTSGATSVTNSVSAHPIVVTPKPGDKNQSAKEPPQSTTDGVKPSGFAARITKIVKDAKADANAGVEAWRQKAEQSISTTSTADEETALRRANDLALSQWKYVALVAKKVTEKRTQIRESRVTPQRMSSIFAPLGISALPRDRRQDATYGSAMRKNSAFGGAFAQLALEEDDAEDCNVSVHDDQGNPLLIPNVSDLWEDFHSADGSDDSLVFTEHDAVTIDNARRKHEAATEDESTEASLSASQSSDAASAAGSAVHATSTDAAPGTPRPPASPPHEPQQVASPAAQSVVAQQSGTGYGYGRGGGRNNYAGNAQGFYPGAYPQRRPTLQQPDPRVQEQLLRQQLLQQQRQQLLQQHAQQQQQQQQQQLQLQQQQQAQHHTSSPASTDFNQTYPTPPHPASPKAQPRPQPQQRPSAYAGKLPWPQPDIYHGRFVDTSHSPYVDFTALTGVKLSESRRVDSPSWKALKVADAK